MKKSSIISWPVFIWTNNIDKNKTSKARSKKKTIEIQHKKTIYFNVSQTFFLCKSYIQLTRLFSLYFCSFPVVICICIWLCTLKVFIFKKRNTFFVDAFCFCCEEKKRSILFYFQIVLYLSEIYRVPFRWKHLFGRLLGIFVAAFNRSRQLNREHVAYCLHFELSSSLFLKNSCVSNQIGNSAFFTSHRCCLNRYYFVYNNVAANNAIEQK